MIEEIEAFKLINNQSKKNTGENSKRRKRDKESKIVGKTKGE